MLHEMKSRARVEYGSIRYIVHQGVQALPKIETKVLKLAKESKSKGPKAKKQKIEDDSVPDDVSEE